MCDGLSRNLPKELETILANCMAHGRRKFVEIYDRFSEECRRVIKALKVVYRNDKVRPRSRACRPKSGLRITRPIASP